MPYSDEIEALYDLVAAQFNDNITGDITPARARKVFGRLLEYVANLNTNQVKGAPFRVPFIVYEGALVTVPTALIPQRSRILGMEVVAINGTDAESAEAYNIQADPITFRLIAHSQGRVDALVDEKATTTTTIKAHWVRTSGTEADRIITYPAFIPRAHSYKANEVFRYTFTDQVPAVTRLFMWRAASTTVEHPLPTGQDDDPIYAPFSPLNAGTALASTDELPEGGTNRYYTDARAVAAPLTGYARPNAMRAIAQTDSVRTALGLLERKADSFVPGLSEDDLRAYNTDFVDPFLFTNLANERTLTGGPSIRLVSPFESIRLVGGGTFNINLPTAANGSGFFTGIRVPRNSPAATVTLTTGNTLDGAASFQMAPGEWRIIGLDNGASNTYTTFLSGGPTTTQQTTPAGPAGAATFAAQVGTVLDFAATYQRRTFVAAGEAVAIGTFANAVLGARVRVQWVSRNAADTLDVGEQLSGFAREGSRGFFFNPGVNNVTTFLITGTVATTGANTFQAINDYLVS